MIGAFLLPFPFRGQKAPYLWVFYNLLSQIKEPMFFMLDESYLTNPQEWIEQQRWEVTKETCASQNYEIPSPQMLQSQECSFASQQLFEQLLQDCQGNPLRAFKRFLTERITYLERWLDNCLDEYAKQHADEPLETILTWCNCPSLKAVASAKGIAVIHVELGPLRAPMFQPTAYFDFSGVNGYTEAANRYQQSAVGAVNLTLRSLYNFFAHQRLEGNLPVAAMTGVVLQVEDDSNLIAFNNTFDNQALIDYVSIHQKSANLLIRAHPGSMFALKSDRFQIDSSGNSQDFICRCQHVFTINSSVGLESLMMGIKTTVLGDTSYRYILDAKTESELIVRLAYYLFAYLVPRSLVLSPEYIRFRLAKPTDTDIVIRHLHAYLGDKSWFDHKAEFTMECLVEQGVKYMQLNELNKLLAERDSQVASLNQTVTEREGQITALSQTVTEHEGQITTLNTDLQTVRQLACVMENTISWRITKPLRVARCLLSAAGLVIGNLIAIASFLRQHPREFGHFGVLLKKHGLIEALKRTASFIKRGGPRPISAAPIVHAFVLRAIDKPIVILTTFHCDYVAVSILTALKKIGISSKIIYERPIEGFEDVPHFVICPQMFSQLPGLYVSFQMEQSVSSRWFTDDYIRKLENSFAIFDYSTVNIAFLQQKGLSRKQIYFLPIDYVTNYKSTREDADCDVIFYGDINNERRKMFISELKKHCTVKVINNLFGDELYAELAKARVIVNIHYYSGALLETTRIWECLSLNKLVVSERSSDMDQHANLEQFIDFVEIDDVSGMVERVKYWLNHDELRHQYISNNKSKLEQQPNQFEYFFYRFLLATDNIGFDDFWNVAGHKVILPSDKVCLHLPEDVVRTTDFSNDNHYDFSFFAGLRHTQGWIGCAMSYKFMIMLARQQGLSKVTICEDDVEFPPDFASKWQEIQRYLDDRVLDWDVFSGLLAHLSDEANVSNVHSTHVLQYVTIDRLISMVFNVYNRQMYDVIAQWDSTNHDVQTNTIDRYLEAYKLKIITTSPFLVGHKEDLQSTIWGFQNTQYRDLIANSSKLLKAKILEHEK